MSNESIQKIIIEKLSAISTTDAHIDENTKIIADLGIDSITVMEFIMEIEEKYNIDIPQNDIVDLYTVKDFETYIRKRIN